MVVPGKEVLHLLPRVGSPSAWKYLFKLGAATDGCPMLPAGLIQSAGDGTETRKSILENKPGGRSGCQIAFTFSTYNPVLQSESASTPKIHSQLSQAGILNSKAGLALQSLSFDNAIQQLQYLQSSLIADYSLQMGKLKINILPPVEGSPLSYPTEKAHDAASVLEWLKSACGDGFLIDCNRTPVFSDPLRQLDAGEYSYHRVDEQGEGHIATTPWQVSRGPLQPGRVHVTALP